MRKAFTLIEMVVALGIMALVLSFAGVIFQVSIKSQRMAQANAEIMQKLRVITEQIDADFRGLRKDGEILAIWSARRKPLVAGRDPNLPGLNVNDPRAFERSDRIMFFTSGDFQTYDTNPVVRGNLARVCYTLARGPSSDPAEPNWPWMQKPSERRLARTQHILIPPVEGDVDRLDTSVFQQDADWLAWNSQGEFDKISLAEWKQIPWQEKVNILSVIGDIEIRDDSAGIVSTTGKPARGVLIDTAQPASIHSLLCKGVGQFVVQGWSDELKRWVPEVNPNGDNSLDDDSDFLLQDGDIHPDEDPGLWYPRGALTLGARYAGTIPPVDQMDEEHFSAVPGLGRALKFTFTLYDSRGLIPNGRTFTHMVYLDD